jgi:C_GCAxxG_C_C family probable redox protein
MHWDESSEAIGRGMEKMNLSLDVGERSAGRLRNRSVANLLRMGHCAPTIMQSALDEAHVDAPWLVKLLAGLPGGIGNTGGECGGVTAPLVLLGLKHQDEVDDRGVPVVLTKGQALLQRFEAAQGSTSCRTIRGEARVPLRCIGVIREAPVLAAECLNDAPPRPVEGETARRARLCAYWRAEDFHCARAVLRQLAPEITITDDLLAATSGFAGGTALAGLTCSALTAGIMALGLVLGEIEDSRVRVLRMIATMAADGDAFADHLNAFNRVMNLGHRLAHEFAAEFGSIRCRHITQSDFATDDGVRHYIESGCLGQCKAITRSVAKKVRELVGENTPHSPA